MIHHYKECPGTEKLTKILHLALTEYEDHNKITVQQKEIQQIGQPSSQL